MNDYRNVLERDLARVGPAPFDFDDVARRRDRKRRNQRITAGVVGIAVFVAAVWIVTSGLSLDRSETSVTGADTTRSTETGPTMTESTDSPDAACVAPASDRLGCWFGGLPPEEAVPSTQMGEVIAQSTAMDVGFVYVYADGRVLLDATWEIPGTILQRQLTRESLERVRSGELKPERLVGALQLPPLWEGEGRVYVAPRYAICYVGEVGNVLDPSGVVDRLLPSEAEALLRGKERSYDHVAGLAGGNIPPATCYELTLDEARVLDDILSNATRQLDILKHPAFEREVGARGELRFMPTGRIGEPGQPPEWHGQPISISFSPLLPHGEWIARTE